MDKFLHLPERMSLHAPIVDHMLNALHWFMFVLFVGWTCFFLFCLWRFRKSRNPKASYTGVRNHLSTHAEVGVVLVEVFLLIGFAIPFWSKRANQFPNPAEAVNVRAVGQQFLWIFHYPGKDGVFGKQKISLVSPSNEIGLDPTDPAGKDDIVVKNELRLPVGRPAIIQLSSKDVIHNFAIREMRIAQDAIPGSEIPMWFTPDKTGECTVICGQLCGWGHYAMQATLSVVTPTEFDEFIASATPAP